MIIRICCYLIAIAFSGYACRPYLKHKYRLERNFSFETRKEYLDYLTKNTGIPADQWLFIDSVHYLDFMNDIRENDQSFLFWGTLTDSSHKSYPKDSSSFNCIGKIASFILDLEKNRATVCNKAEISTRGFIHVASEEAFSIEKTNLYPLHFLMYGYGYGHYHFPFFKRIYNQVFNKKSVYFICMDPIYQLK